MAVTSVVYEVKQAVTSVVFKVKQAITSVVYEVKQAVTSVHTFQVLGICRLSPFHLSAGWKYGKEIKEILLRNYQIIIFIG